MDLGCLLQSLRLIATKGHFTADILVAVLLAVGCDAALEYPEMGCEAAVGLEGGAFFLTVLATLLFGTFSIASFGYYAFQVQKSDDDDWDTALFLVCLAFAACFFWAQQVLKYVITCATASTANNWWFGKDVAPLSAFSRAVTYHYGAICFGALVVAPIESIATSINSMKRASARAESGAVSSVLSGCLCCITTVLQCCESILDYFNKFAFCLVGMRGASYAYASRQIVALFGTQGCIAAGADAYAEAARRATRARTRAPLTGTHTHSRAHVARALGPTSRESLRPASCDATVIR